MNKKCRLAMGAAAVLCLISTVLSLLLGAVGLTLPELWRAACYGPQDTAGRIFWFARLPRTVACLLSGSALAVAGAVIQGVLSNKLASPSIIGVNAGAGLAVTICCALGALSGWAIALSSFTGGLLAVLLISVVAQKTGASRTTVILGGVAVNSFLNALSEAIITLIPDVGLLSGEFRVGGFASVSYLRLIPAGVLIVIALVVLFSLHNQLDVLALGEDTANGLGMNVRKVRTLFLILAAMLAGASVSFAGLLGFVGLIVPHAMRHFVGSESRFLLPMCALGGACFVTACDVVARVAFSPFEMPVGVLMSVLGGPFFVFLLLKKRGAGGND